MEKLEHDPRTKQQIKNALYGFIYEPVQRQFKDRIDILIARNTLIGGYSHNHFVYKGVTYNSDATTPPLKKNRLMAALRPDMESYLHDQAQLNLHEVPYVLGFINQVLNSSCDLTDYLRVLPDSVHQPLLDLMATCPCQSRTLDEAKVLQLKVKNQASIAMMKQRLFTNLLI